jgi:uncharacterized protein YbaP (TraB family)
MAAYGAIVFILIMEREFVPQKFGSAVLITVIGIAFSASRFAPADPAVSAPALDEVLVTGERAGPGMWCIRKGDHELWLLGVQSPLPKDMNWRSTAVDRRIAESQAVLAPPDIDFDVGFFRGLTLLPSLLHARKDPEGLTLEQRLPHELYMRWLALRVKYLPADDEHLRPLVAAHDLYTHAVAASGLSDDDQIWDRVKQAARHDRVPVVPVTLKLPLSDPKGAIGALAQLPADAEIGCLDTTMTRLETDLQAMKQRANAWSLGDIATLRALPYADQDLACFDALFSVPTLRDRFQDLVDRLRATWLAAAERSLGEHASSFAVLPMTAILREDGVLTALRARGYEIQEP